MPKEGTTTLDKCALFAPLIEEAAKKRADLVVLPETLTAFRGKWDYEVAAEPIPGPSTAYFGKLAMPARVVTASETLPCPFHGTSRRSITLWPSGARKRNGSWIACPWSGGAQR